MKRKREIHQSGDETYNSHRGDFETCPHCGHHMRDNQWQQVAHTLCLQARVFVSSCASIMSECAECFETSWVHINLRGLFNDSWPESWRKALMETSEARRLAAHRQWETGLCRKCKFLKQKTVDHSAYRTCSVGMGPPVSECTTFEEV